MEQSSVVHQCIIKKSGSTHIKFKEYHYTWTILNFSRYKLTGDNYLESPTFTSGKNDEYEWVLDLYIDDFLTPRATVTDYMVLEVLLRAHETSKLTKNDQSKVYIEVGFINKEEKEHIVGKKLCELDAKINDDFKIVHGFEDCIKKSFVFDENNGLLPNDQFTILCKLYFYEDTYTIQHPIESTSVTEEISSEHRLEIFDHFEQLLENGKFSDVKLIVDDKKFHVHKNILSARSPVFSNLFEHQEKTSDSIEIMDVDYNVMKEVLRFIYTGKANNIKDICPELLVAAIKYQLEKLKVTCIELLIAEMNVGNVYQSLVLVDKYNLEKFKDVTIKFVCTHAKDLANAKDFLKDIHSLTPSLLSKIIEALAIKLQ